jgi:hypothetical protein
MKRKLGRSATASGSHYQREGERRSKPYKQLDVLRTRPEELLREGMR